MTTSYLYHAQGIRGYISKFMTSQILSQVSLTRYSVKNPFYPQIPDFYFAMSASFVV